MMCVAKGNPETMGEVVYKTWSRRAHMPLYDTAISMLLGKAWGVGSLLCRRNSTFPEVLLAPSHRIQVKAA